ncbi:MAG: ATP-binding protein [Pseudomonadota bacterium]
MTGELKRSISLTLGTLVFLALLAIMALTKDLSDRLGDVAEAATDNVQWVISQAEVEYLMFNAAIAQVEREGPPALPALRNRFDIFYSRIAMLGRSAAFETLRDDPDFRSALQNSTAFLEKMVPLIDGPDQMLLAALPQIESESVARRGDVRALGLTAISYFAERGDIRRRGVETTLLHVILLSAGLIAVLLLVSGLLFFLVARLRQSSELAESARARMSAIVASSLDAVIVANRKGEIIEFNPASEQIFGYRADEVIGQEMSQTIVPPHLRAAHDAGMKRYLETEEPKVIGAGRVQLEAIRKDGAIFPVELSIASASTQDEEVFVSFLRDITDRLAGEEELRDARDRALAGERAKAEFIAVMSHEMRTPLNGLLGTLELIDASALSEKDTRYLNMIENSGRLLLQHVNDVLDIAEADSGQGAPDLAPLDLHEIVSGVTESQTALADAAGTKITLEFGQGTAGPALGDRRKLRQILFNLIGNAVKFTRNGEVTVTLERLGNSDEVELQVLDTGIGIQEEDLDKVFDDFVTLNSGYDRETSGTGLGLAITRRIVTQLDGEIGVESDLGEGSVFWVRLPLPLVDHAQAPSQASHTPVASSHGQRQGRLLVAEDNDINRTIVEVMLSEAGYEVVTARDGAEAVSRAEDEEFDAILMDISMPKMNGLDATRVIRKSGHNRNVPIIAITAHALRDEVRRFKEAGINAVIVKPMSRDALLKTLAQPFEATTDARAQQQVNHRNLADLEAEMGPDRFSGLLRAFISQTDQTVSHLTSVAPGEIPDAELLAEIHRLAGAAATFGATQLHAELNRLEDRGKSGNIDEVWTDLARLKDLWASSRGTFQERASLEGA